MMAKQAWPPRTHAHIAKLLPVTLLSHKEEGKGGGEEGGEDRINQKYVFQILRKKSANTTSRGF